MGTGRTAYPKGKDFIFTICDDTDVATLEYIRPVYDFLSDLGMLTTKTVWPLSYDGPSDYRGSHTLQDPGYAKYIVELRDRGFEIGYHGPSLVSMDRSHIQLSFDVFHDVLSSYPRMYAAHATNRENLYWGAERFSFPLFRLLYSVMTRTADAYYQGHVEGTPYFWGDLALRHIDYMRGFTYREMNLLNLSKAITYRDSRCTWVKNWFITGDADNVEEFNRLLGERDQERLEKKHGVCIISTHFGKGYVHHGGLHKRTRTLLKQLSRRNGWFVPVSTALDFLKTTYAPDKDVPHLTLLILELKWLLDLVKRRGGHLPYEKTELPYLKH